MKMMMKKIKDNKSKKKKKKNKKCRLFQSIINNNLRNKNKIMMLIFF